MFPTVYNVLNMALAFDDRKFVPAGGRESLFWFALVVANGDRLRLTGLPFAVSAGESITDTICDDRSAAIPRLMSNSRTPYFAPGSESDLLQSCQIDLLALRLQ